MPILYSLDRGTKLLLHSNLTEYQLISKFHSDFFRASTWACPTIRVSKNLGR